MSTLRLLTDPLDDRLREWAEKKAVEDHVELYRVWRLEELWNEVHQGNNKHDRFTAQEKGRFEGALQRVGFDRASNGKYRGWKATVEFMAACIRSDQECYGEGVAAKKILAPASFVLGSALTPLTPRVH